jgi:hypothetical protein
MSKKFDGYIDIAKELISNDKDRDLLYMGIDDMWHGNWSAGAELNARGDFREVIDLSPHDALRAGTSIMATVNPKWTVQPFNTGDEERQRAEKIEYVLDWHFNQMSRRGKGTMLWDLVHSALRYDAVAIWLDYLPYWIGKNPTGRAKAALRNGPFVGTIVNPRFVHSQSDQYGDYRVLHASTKSAIEVANYWQSRNEKKSEGLSELQEVIRKNKNLDLYFHHYDFMVYEGDQLRREVWGSVSEFDTLDANADGQYILMDEKVTTPFMNWIIKVGGSSMETESKYSVHPLLAPLWCGHTNGTTRISRSQLFSLKSLSTLALRELLQKRPLEMDLR